MRGSRWSAFAFCAVLAACGGAIVPTGVHDDGGDPDSSSGSGSSSGVISGSSSGPVVSSGSSGSGSSTGGSSGGSSSSGSGSTSGSTSSGGVPVDAAFACTGNVPPPMTGFGPCDTCIEDFCGDQWCTCMGDSSIDDAGMFHGCLGFVSCVQYCLFPADGGAGPPVSQCASECSPGYSQQQVQEGATFLSCLVGSCASPNTCGE